MKEISLNFEELISVLPYDKVVMIKKSKYEEVSA